MSVAAWEYLVNASAGDYYVLYWSAPSTAVSMVYQAATTSPTRPSSPSVNVNVTQVMYTQIGPTGPAGASALPILLYSGTTVKVFLVGGYLVVTTYSGSTVNVAIV